MTHQDLFKLLQSIRKNIHCPQCGKSYGFNQIQIRGIVDSIVFLEMACKSHMPVLATVTYAPDKLKNLNLDEKISSNDVLAAHAFLKNFSGNFEQVFKNT